jgi:hypothetical protein
MSSSSPEAKPAQPKDAQDPSGAKDLVASDPEQEKQPVYTGDGDGATAKVEASGAPVTKSQPEAAPPVSSEKPPLPPPDSTPAATTPDPEKRQDSTVPTATAGVPAEPGPRVPDAQERARKKRLLIIHTRLARFFTWILLLGFVILPSTLTKDGKQTGSDLADRARNRVANLGLFAIGYICCLVNAIAICSLWHIRKDDHEWLLTNLFSAGLINAFSGLITTFVNFWGVQSGAGGSSSYSTLVLASFCTFVYAVLTTVYFRKRLRLRARNRRGSRASSAIV